MNEGASLKKDVLTSLDRTNKSSGQCTSQKAKRLRVGKTKYFFKPMNNLNGELDERLCERSKLIEKDNVKRDIIEGTNDQIIIEMQSSDDSYEGIKWRTSPRVLKKNTTDSGLPSSPLKQTNPDSLPQAHQKSSGALMNEQASFMLSKYGSDFSNLHTQATPIKKTFSDIVPENLRKKELLLNPRERLSLKRAKSTNGESLSEVNREGVSTSKEERHNNRINYSLNRWIDMFEDEEQVKVYHDQISKEGKECVASSLNDVEKEDNINKTQEIVDDIDFSDNFSDSRTISSEKSSAEADESDSDPFTSDDENILSAIVSESMNKHCVALDTLDPTHQHLEELRIAPSAKYESSTIYSQVASRTRNTSHESDIGKKTNCQSIKGSSNSSFLGDDSLKLGFARENLQRFKVKKKIENKYTKENKTKKQLILQVTDVKGMERNLILRGEYLQLDIQKNDIVHLIVTSKDSSSIVDDNHNLLVWNPDILVSATSVSQLLGCPRKTILLDRYAFPGECSLPLIIGIIVHEIFQACFYEHKWDFRFMRAVMTDEIEKHLIEIYSLGDVLEKIKSEVNAQLPYLEQWFRKYYRQAQKSARNLVLKKPHDDLYLSVNRALDIEENVWSPMYGLKGKIDVTLDACLLHNEEKQDLILPMEIKTGREHISHHAQSSLYSLLLRDRYNIDVVSFLLVYTRERITRNYSISQTDLKSLVNLRNRITKYLKLGTRELPSLIKQTQCDTCEAQEPCMVLNNLCEKGTVESSGLTEGLYESLTLHLADSKKKERYKSFYNHWDILITKEEAIIKAVRNELWTLSSKSREYTTGKAVGMLKLVKSEQDLSRNEFRYTFERDSNLNPSLQNTHLAKHDKIIISDEEGHFALGQGYIEAIRPSFLIITTFKRINQWKSFPRAKKGTVTTVGGCSISQEPNMLYRVDIDDMFHGMSLARFNILNLFLESGDKKRKELIVESKAPEFGTSSFSYTLPHSFNPDQRRAVEHVLKAKDYALLLGMPGTGKTTLIAYLIKILVDNNKSVLLTSYTHSAVDNILLKVREYGVKFLRLGSFSRMHDEIKVSSLNASLDKFSTYDDFLKKYMEPSVVATTCLGIGDIAFSIRKSFDYCIVDEASQISMPICLGPLRFADKFILIGDHYQLPPLVKHPDPTVKEELSKSLFKFLNDEHPESVSSLTFQYRMCSEIMELSNSLVYEGKLRCGSSLVAGKCLNIKHPEVMDRYIRKEKDGSIPSQEKLWLHAILNENNKVVFIDHDKVPAKERKVCEKIENITEAKLVRQIVQALTSCGVDETNIGIMSQYRAQLRLLHRYLLQFSNVEILTPDQFQGRDKECIIISLVRSNDQKIVGDLLREFRRINVALTRAKSKLIILGSKSTLYSEKVVKDFLELIEKRNWSYELLPEADSAYEFDHITHNSQGRSQEASHTVLKAPKLLRKTNVINDIVNNYK